MLSKMRNKTSAQYLLVQANLHILFFKLLFGCLATNFGPLSRGHPKSPMLISVSKILIQRSIGTLQRGFSTKLVNQH